MTLVLTAAQASHLSRLAEAAYPREACALLVGRKTMQGWIVSEIVEGANVAASPEQEFEFDPAVQIRLLRRLRESGASECLVGHYHSHPNGRAEPSAKDAAMAHDLSLLWVISAVTEGKAGMPRAFKPDSYGGFAPFPLDIVQQDS